MAKSYYGRTAGGQMQGIFTRPASGLNEYTPPSEINDNYLSKALDASPYRDETFYLYSTALDTAVDSDFDGTGIILCAIADKIPTNATNMSYDDHLVMIKCDTAFTVCGILDFNITQGTVSADGITGMIFNETLYHSMCVFVTEANRYVCYVNSYQKKLLYYDYTSYKLVNLPFYPKKIVSHVNRVFAMDTGNKIWWCRAGDLTSWYGLEEDDDYIVTSVDMANGAYTIAHQPDVPRVLTSTVTATSTLDTLGTVTAVGTDVLDKPQTEVATLEAGKLVWYKAFKTLTSLTQAGHTAAAGADKIKIGIGAVGNGYVQADSGFWTLEQERMLVNMAVIGNSLFIWSDVNIYEFLGYSPDTFTLAKRISDIGCDYDYKNEVTVSNNVSYFSFSGDLYEFNGEAYPRIISRPINAGGGIINGIAGGINVSYGTYAGLASDKNYLYVYDKKTTGVAAGSNIQLYYYVFDIKARTWWKKSGYYSLSANTSDECRAMYIPQADRSGMYNIKMYTDPDNGLMYILTTNKGANENTLPFVVTKAFNTNPSENGTLTALILNIKSASTATGTINVYYSLTVDQDDFTIMYSDTDYHFNGDLEQITINVPQYAIVKAHHYRIKIEVDSTSIIYFYNIERRFRVTGRSR